MYHLHRIFDGGLPFTNINRYRKCDFLKTAAQRIELRAAVIRVKV